MKVTGSSARVLVVEDEAIISLDIKRLLANSGYAIAAVAASSEEAIKAIKTTAPDLVLMDIHIKGGIDGIDTALQIRRDFGLPVVFVTAHADKTTLERARQTEPFGYIVKPISPLSLTGTIEMALHKHRIERQLEEHRAWLTTILQSVPDAVFVTDLLGQVQFLNWAAEHLTGLQQASAVGKPVDSVLSLSSGAQKNLASLLMDKAEWGNRISLPKETLLRSTDSKATIQVEGDVVISYLADEPAGAVFTLRDVSRRGQEESILRQEERMLALGQLASNMARDFSSLLNVLSSTCDELSGLANELRGEQRALLLDKTDTISRVNSIGLLMAEQLIDLNAPPSVRATLVSASGVLASVEPLFIKLSGGASLQVSLHLTDESTLILCHPDRLRILLINVFLNARERMAGSGRIRVSTRQAGNRVAILFELEHIGISSCKPLSFPLQMENPDFPISIAQAVVGAMEGSISFTALSDTQGRIEILLPLQHATPDLVDSINRRGTILLVGSDLELFSQIERHMEEIQYGIIRCASAAEALLLGQLYDGKIDCVIADGETTTILNRRKLLPFFSNRNPATRFIRLAGNEQSDELGWRSLRNAPSGSVAERLGSLLTKDERQMKASN